MIGWKIKDSLKKKEMKIPTNFGMAGCFEHSSTYDFVYMQFNLFP